MKIDYFRTVPKSVYMLIFNLILIFQSDWLIAWRKFCLYSITWVGIVTSPTCSYANDKFKLSHEIIVIKIEKSLNFVVKIKL
jgi:hypothetical protein